MKEEWKQVPGYEGIYEASNTGKIRTCEGKTTYSDFHGARVWQSRELKGCGDNPDTGKIVGLWKNGQCKRFLFARIIAATWLGLNIHEKYVAGKSLTVNHKDGDRLNNSLDNLEVVSMKENMRHAMDTGLQTWLKSIVLINTKTLQETKYKSYSDAGRAIGRSVGYISGCIISRKTYAYSFDGEQFKIMYTPVEKTQDNRFRWSGKKILRKSIIIESVDGKQLKFDTLTDCAKFLQRSKSYITTNNAKGKINLIHASGEIYKIINIGEQS